MKRCGTHDSLFWGLDGGAPARGCRDLHQQVLELFFVVVVVKKQGLVVPSVFHTPPKSLLSRAGNVIFPVITHNIFD